MSTMDVLLCDKFEKPIDKLLYISLLEFNEIDITEVSLNTLRTILSVNSKNTIRASLSRLVELGLIEIKNNRGGFQEGIQPNTFVIKEVPAGFFDSNINLEKDVFRK